jgi:uncharacterized protein (TIGR03000 family)
VSRTLTLCYAGLAAFALLAVTAPVWSDDAAKAPAADEGKPISLIVTVPTADAKLFIEGKETKTTGKKIRTFISPKVVEEPNKKYIYTLKAMWKEGDKDLEKEVKVEVKPGGEYTVVVQDREPDVIYVPTPQDVVDKMLELANVKKDDVVWDLGCGDGRIPVTAAKKYGCKAMGFDIDPERIKDSLANVEKNKVKDLVTIEKKDIFTLDLSKGPTVVTLYLLPDLNVKLIPQLEKLPKGARIVSHDFDMKGVTPDKVVKVTPKGDNEREHTIYLWTVPLKKENK